MTREQRPNLTAGELIEQLSRINPDFIVKTSEHDSEWGYTYVWSVSAVSTNGYLIHGNLIESYGDDDE